MASGKQAGAVLEQSASTKRAHILTFKHEAEKANWEGYGTSSGEIKPLRILGVKVLRSVGSSLTSPPLVTASHALVISI